jgi:predicted phage terminase large subunit-like protein
MAELRVALHHGQLDVFKSPKKRKVVCAGRRWGKTELAAWVLITEALKSETLDTAYVCPTFAMGKQIIWDKLKRLGAPVIKDCHENTATVTLINGRKIYVKGSDRPDTLRGSGYAYLVLDEIQDMKPETWELALQPTLADCDGGALFIGTPKGKNWFYDLYLNAESEDEDVRAEWDAWQFKTIDNPFLSKAVVEQSRKTMSSFAFRQEFEATFESAGSGLFKEEWFKVVDEAPFKGGFTFMAVDPAGFADIEKEAQLKNNRLDDTAIAIVTVAQEGWFVKEIIAGRWDVRETSIRILRAAQKHQVSTIGIESGSLKNALAPYMEDQMRRLNVYPHIEAVSHGKQNKTERIVWSLQGRMEHGRVWFQRGDWNRKFLTQMLDFPNPKVHDDMIDALAYVDQIQTADYSSSFEIDEYEPLDELTGW